MPVPAIQPTDANIIEAFSSIQGEGILVGCRQIFLRLPNCNLSCEYCDTPFDPTPYCQVEENPGSGFFTKLPNPVALSTLSNFFKAWIDSAPGAHHSFSITGGEPLLHTDLLSGWLPELRKHLPIYLETNGTLPDQLEVLLPLVDWISMDIKLESIAGMKTDWTAHRSFLELACQKNCYVKIVVGESTSLDEVIQAARLINQVSESVPLILQPVTQCGSSKLPVKALLDFQLNAAKIHKDVRIIPQTHVFLGLL